jgi:hypothetical protein
MSEDKRPDWLNHAISAWESGHHQDGEILTHDWIRWALQIPVPKSLMDAERVQWVMLSRVEAFKDWLLTERETALQSVRGKGYWVVPPSEQARVAAEEWAKHVSKAMKKADSLLEHTRMESLTTDERRRHTDTQIRMAGVAGIITRQKRDIFGLVKQ